MDSNCQIESIVISSDEEDSLPAATPWTRPDRVHGMRMRPRKNAGSVKGLATTPAKPATGTSTPSSHIVPASTPRVYQRLKVPRTFVIEPPPTQPPTSGSQDSSSSRITSIASRPTNSQADLKPRSSRTTFPSERHPYVHPPPKSVSSTSSTASQPIVLDHDVGEDPPSSSPQGLNGVSLSLISPATFIHPSLMTASQPSTPLSLPLKHPRNDSLYPSITDEEPPQTNKRRKQGTQNSWDHHPLWWKTDGSVIIRCGRTVFKLHKTILAGASPYFSELFQSSATESLEEIAGEKLPMYLIAFGNVPAFAHILNLLYNALEFMQHIPSDATLDLIVRASTALSFSTIRDWAVKLLEAQWSADVTQVTTTPAHRALETILLAKACRIPQILKRACYEAIRINTFGDTMRGPSLQEFHNANVVEATRTAEPFVRLSSKDVVALFRAHGRLSDEWVRCAATPPTEYRCSHGPQPVAYEPARWNTMVHASGLFVRYLHDPIAGIAEIRRNIILEEDVFCGACREAIEAAWKKSLETIWEQYDVGLEEDLLA